MKNNFQIGSVVKGDSFIGRHELIKQYRTQIITKEKSSSISIRGITRIGKTSFINTVFESIPAGYIYSNVDLKEVSSYYELWLCLMEPIRDFLSVNELMTDEISGYFNVLENETTLWIKFVRTIKRIFSYLSNNDLKCILVLDEFDNASIIFENETKKYELFRSVVSDANFNITAILISRRNLHEIEGQTFQCSTFKGVFDARYFKGFTLTDMEEYYSVFEKKNIILTDKQKREIEYYAGNSPYLLSILGHRIIDAKLNAKQIDISEIFKNDCTQINEYYSDVLKHLTRDGSKDKLISFVLGPNIGVSRADRDELLNLGYLREDGDNFIPISKYFADYLRMQKVNKSIWENLTITEKKIKIVLEKETEEIKKALKIGDSDLKNTQRRILECISSISSDALKHCSWTINSNKREWNLDTTYFDALTLKDALKVIETFWEVFCKYFNNDSFSSWKYKFTLIGKARNPPAHAHEEYLQASVKQEVDGYCNDIQRSISKAYEI